MSTSTRRTFPWGLLVAAFIAVPLVEIYVIVQIGQVIGAWWTILLLVVDSLIGAWLVRREGGRAWRSLRNALEERRMPHRELADGVLILVGGTLMLTPGFVTDALGVLCILPITRPVGRRALARVISRRLVMTPGAPGGAAAGFGAGFGAPGPDPRPDSRQDPRRNTRGDDGPDQGVVPGEVVD